MDQEYPPEFYEPDLTKFEPTFVGPTGTGLDLYVVAEALGKEEVKRGECLIGDAGQLFRRASREADVPLEKITMWNTIPFRPFIRNSNGQVKDRTPTMGEIDLYSSYVKTDIRKKRPKVILLLGAVAMKAFGIKVGKIDDVRPGKYDFEGIPVYATFHPSGINRLGGIHHPRYKILVADIKRASANSPFVPSEFQAEVIDVREWDRVEEIFKDDYEIALDFEASGLNVYHHDYTVGGIAIKGGKTETTVYVMLYNFWRTPEEFEVPDQLKRRIGLWLQSKKLIVFNLQYECGACLNYFKAYIRDVVDVMIMNRTLSQGGGLKDIASVRLGVFTWDTQIHEWNELVGRIAKAIKPTYKGRIRDEVAFLNEGTCNSIDDLLLWFESQKARLKKVTDRFEEAENVFRQINDLAKRHYTGDRYIEFCKRFFKLVIKKSSEKDPGIVRYTDVPIEIVAPYAADDVGYTLELKEHLGKEIEKKELKRISDIYNDMAKLGFELESSGIAWNDELATRLDKVYKERAINSLRLLLTIPKFQKILPSSLSTEEKFVSISECPQDILEIQTTVDPEKLKDFFNPLSTHTTTRDRFSQLICTRRVKFLMLLSAIFKDYQNTKEECLKEFPVLCPTLEDITAEPDSTERVRMLDNLMEDEGRVLGHKISAHPGNADHLWRDSKGASPPELRMYKDYSVWSLPGMKSGDIEDVYNAFVHIAGINIDDENTWTEEFRYLYHFRLYKKVMKSYSTYIWGKVGRDNAALIDKTAVHDPFAIRYPGWVATPRQDRIWIKETNFSVITAVTKRWQSGDHTVPGGELIDLRVSRFSDGVRLHWDLSQSEIRVMAKMANDENLLQKFAEDADIHLFIASKIWGKPEKVISKIERKHSKSAVFAVLYGDSPPSFAIKFLNGDLQLAEYIFNQLFTMFPNIEKFIKQQHRHALEKGEIRTYFDDPITNLGVPIEALELKPYQKEELLRDVFSKKVRLSKEREQDKKLRHMLCKAFRNAQNYPIQSTSSTLAGLGVYYMSNYIRDECLSARVDCFTHDSGDIDTQIADLPKIISVLRKYAVDDVVKEWKIPIKAEYEIGVSGNQMVELKNAFVDGPIICSTFHESKRTAVDALEDRLTRYGVKTEITIDEEVENMRSLSELFMARGAFNLAIGQREKLVTGKMKLDFTNAKRESYENIAI